MKRLFIIGLLLIAVLAGCAAQEALPQKGDFSFELPDGYSISNLTDESCSIVRDENSVIVGGIEITELSRKDLKDTESKNILLYLQNDFHKTNNIEFFAFHGGDEHPIVSISLTKIEDDTEEKFYFYHVFFERDSAVYHMWFDLSVIDAELTDQFISIVCKN